MPLETLKIACVLEGDSAIDFERLSMVLKSQNYAQNRPKQQAVMVGASLLVLDSMMRRYSDETGKRYPTIEEVLEYAGCREIDVATVLNKPIKNEQGQVPIEALKGAVQQQEGSEKP
ncbi:hypothetical protein [Chromobacterium haemolyticum]|uniref:hypothetical protein n=1 Tax=Chromobacterium haemolyticum TaxID=394935 RepID=UPI00244C5CDF|nr:hypothetical protein [Chromobacterium haemolyticum]MDH0342095.1 hypothetical protein [Chromobacterium haemolyticum]